MHDHKAGGGQSRPWNCFTTAPAMCKQHASLRQPEHARGINSRREADGGKRRAAYLLPGHRVGLRGHSLHRLFEDEPAVGWKKGNMQCV